MKPCVCHNRCCLESSLLYDFVPLGWNIIIIQTLNILISGVKDFGSEGGKECLEVREARWNGMGEWDDF